MPTKTTSKETVMAMNPYTIKTNLYLIWYIVRYSNLKSKDNQQ